MTQSGQGEELSAQPAREGIVLPSDGGAPLLPGTNATPAAPAGGQAWGGTWGPEQQAPQAGQPGQGWPPAAAQQWTDHGAPAQQPPSGAGPLPPEGAPAPSYGGQQPGYGAPDPYQQQHHQQHQPQQHQQPRYPEHGQAAAPLPPAAPGGYQAPGALPPVADGATQYLPPVPAAPADEGATQYIPPVTPGALPPQSAGEETRYLGLTDKRPSPDAEATQYIPPYQEQGQAPGQAPGQGGDRQPPAEFDNLFRNGPAGGDGPAGATAQLPRVEPDAYPPPYASPQTAYSARSAREDGQDERPRRKPSKVPLIAAVGIGIVVVGVGAGALLSSGGGSGGTDDNKTVAATSAAPQSSASAVDPARAQAVELDKLLADSGSSRAAVIKSVADVKQCASLDQAASSLRGAAGQRGQLVTRLGKLSVDKLPDNAALTDALTKAWQASASADNHYAAWADQVKGGGKRTCHKGHAKVTGEAQAGNRASGTASQQKAKAAALWNAIAQKYGLTQRQPTQL
ncbi:hypothetical protein FRZ03_21685 [Streptomyces misionensis]|uniref:Uncharacterized protein n=1 Tax=Streptomyces misionensis TaxID=67331 RepID=A0A5C6JH74_9ACTN|nr:hypothetical protein [Streptomyces misionensis]TWV40875.1 hypothetical protein FRZ03_21685 [Streptomyces misionensis]